MTRVSRTLTASLTSLFVAFSRVERMLPGGDDDALLEHAVSGLVSKRVPLQSAG